MKAKRETLATVPRLLRANPSRGAAPKVERTGGFRRQGIIRGASIVTRGEAAGHGMWLDGGFLQSVADNVNRFNKGVKSRFAHPSLSGDGLGTFLGRTMDATVQGDQVLADIHFADAGHETPDGDLASYVMDLAETDPEAFGVSIVFSHDIGAEDRFTAKHKDEDGNFESPDPDNAQNLRHARLAALHASDVVDEPAANPGGLFHREQEFAAEAEALAAFALGLTSDRPATVALGLDADRVAGFARRFLANHQLEVHKMDEPKAPNSPDATTEPKQDKPQPGDPAQPAAEPPAAESTAQQSAGQRFVDAFGQQGAVWFVEGKNFDECWALSSKQKDERIAQLEAKLVEIEKRLAAATAGEGSPVSFSDTESKTKGKFSGRISVPALPKQK